MPNTPKKKVIRITLEIEVGDRKVWLSKIRGAYQLGTELMVEALNEALPDGSMRDVNSRLEWFYLYERSDKQMDSNGDAVDVQEGEESDD